MRRMLVNAQQAEHLRLAVIDGTTLESYQIEVGDLNLTRGHIYRGIIVNIEPSLNAAFIDYGLEKHGFLPIQDVVPEAMYHEPKKGERPRIDGVLERGRPIVVQVARDPEAKKGAALTTNLSLAGRYLVLTPFGDTIGISRKVEDDEHRKELKAIASKLELPAGCGVIVRTNASEETLAGLRRELKGLLRQWKQIQREARVGKGPRLLYEEGDLVLKALRDSLDSSIAEVLVDDKEAFEQAAEYMKNFMPRSKTKLVHYQERKPLFSKFTLEHKIEAIYQRSVPLPCGGSIVVDPTEALTAIDVNSGRAKSGTQGETAYKTNLEAAVEVARQLRLRDIGGLVVVDFIDMRSRKYQAKVEKTLRDAMKPDQARSSISRISSNGLLEINRQKIRQELRVRTHRTCPTCEGTGRIASNELVGLNLLRRIEARAADGRLESARIELHPEIANGFQNARRRDITALEEEFQMTVEVVAAPALHRAEERVHWIERDAPPPTAVPDEPDETVARTRRRRGPRRRRGAEPREAEPQTPQGPETAPAAAAVEPEPEAAAPAEERSAPRRSGRRRGGRGRGTGRSTAPAATTAPSEPAVEAPREANGPGSDGDGGEPPRRRGRRGRRAPAAEA